MSGATLLSMCSCASEPKPTTTTTPTLLRTAEPAAGASAQPTPVAAPTATAPGAEEEQAPLAVRVGPCGGDRVELAPAFEDAACRGARPDSTPPLDAGRLTIERTTSEPLATRSGAWLAFEVAVRSTSSAPMTLWFELPKPGVSGVDGADIDDALAGGLGLGALAPPRPDRKRAPARAPRRPIERLADVPPDAVEGFGIRADDARGRSVALPPGVGGILGMFGKQRELVRVDLAPRGAAVARVRWHAVGYDQDQPMRPPPGSRPREGFLLPDPSPLKPGTYRLRVVAPLVGSELASEAIDVTVSP